MSHIRDNYTSPRVRSWIVHDYESKKKDEYELAIQWKRHPKTIKRYIKRYRERNTVYTDYELLKKISKNGVVKRIKIFDDKRLQNFVLTGCLLNPTQALRYYPANIYRKFGICCSPKTVDRFFKSKGWTWKKISKIALEIDFQEEYAFWQRFHQIVTDIFQCVWFDESNRSDVTPNPTHARGKGYIVY